MNRWLTWVAFVLVWSAALEFPVPVPDDPDTERFIVTYRYILGRSLHVGAYAMLAVLSAWVPVAVRYRWIMMFFLLAHAWGSEMLQQELKPWFGRSGSLGDVGWDIGGILIGVAVSWKWWIREDPLINP